MKQKALRAGDAHSHEDEECRKRLRSARECAKAHSFFYVYTMSQVQAKHCRRQLFSHWIR